MEALLAEAIARRQAGQLGAAATLFVRLLQAAPPQAHHLLLAADTLCRVGLLRAARDALSAARALAPDMVEIEVLAGRVLAAAGQREEAAAAFGRAVALRETPAALRFLGAVLHGLGRKADSEAAFARADALQPETAEGYNGLGINFLAERRPAEAEAAFRRALAIAPTLVAAHENLGAALAAQDKLEAAIAAERRAVEIAPQAAAGWLNLGVFANAAGDFATARHAWQQAAKLTPDAPHVLTNLAQLHLEEGDDAAALRAADRALALAPGHRAAGDTWLLARNYVATAPTPDWLARARAIAAHLRPDAPPSTGHVNDRTPDRRLRVGFVSADFRHHSCANFLVPLFTAHDRSAYELIAYSDNPTDDAVTQTLRRVANLWRPIGHLGDVSVAELIGDDRIDVLVDLAGHMGGNRLPVFALKPAPVQVSWLGYPDTTGLETIDYRLTDAVADPAGIGEECYSERLWRLPESFLVYAPDSAAPEPPPEEETAAPVYVSFNHLPKVTPEVVATWARILAEIPEARLLMKAKRLSEPETRDRYLRLFGRHGIAPKRLDLVGWQAAPADHLRLYRRAAIGLDPFPYNGTTTTCEALWMGVPVVTLAGQSHAARVGASLLTSVGLPELIATSLDDYVARAVALGRDPRWRRKLRQGLRARMASSPLCDANGFARRFEAALREMWRNWCRSAR